MTSATPAVHNRIALVYDYDDTLAPDSYRSLLERCGLPYDEFMQQRVKPLTDAGWDRILAKFYCLIEASRGGETTITREVLAAVGREAQFFVGVGDMFKRLRAAAKAQIDDVEVEFYLLSSGIVEIAEGAPFADEFTALWGCEFHYAENGAISFIKRIVTHPEKVRYLLQISKGVSKQGEQGQPANVYRRVPDEELRLPLDQIIYVGDGASDMPVFRLLHENHGIAIGVFKGDSAEDWDGYDSMQSRRRVENLAAVDYSPDGELMRSLTLAVERACKQIALRRLSQGE